MVLVVTPHKTAKPPALAKGIPSIRTPSSNPSKLPNLEILFITHSKKVNTFKSISRQGLKQIRYKKVNTLYDIVTNSKTVILLTIKLNRNS
jgi:hypothetical protein